MTYVGNVCNGHRTIRTAICGRLRSMAYHCPVQVPPFRLLLRPFGQRVLIQTTLVSVAVERPVAPMRLLPLKFAPVRLAHTLAGPDRAGVVIVVAVVIVPTGVCRDRRSSICSLQSSRLHLAKPFVQFRTIVKGDVRSSATGTIIRKRPSRVTS